MEIGSLFMVAGSTDVAYNYTIKNEGRKRMDDLIKICDKLESCRKKHPNYQGRIKCTEKILKSYIDGDTDKVLKLKAQLEIHKTPWDSFSAIALLISLITLVLSIFGDLLGTETTEYK